MRRCRIQDLGMSHFERRLEMKKQVLGVFPCYYWFSRSLETILERNQNFRFLMMGFQIFDFFWWCRDGCRGFQKDSFLMIAKMTAQTELWDHPQLDTSHRAHHLRFPQLSRAPRDRFRLVSEKDSFFVHYFLMKYLVLCVHS